MANKMYYAAQQIVQKENFLIATKKVQQSIKNGSTLVESDKVNFRNKRKKYKEHVEQISQNKADDGGEQNDKPKTAKSLARTNVEKFFKGHNIRRSENGIRVGRKVIRVSYDDVIADLTMNNRRMAANLSDGQMNDVLAKLNRMGFPVGNIRSEKIKKNTRIFVNKNLEEELYPVLLYHHQLALED